MSLFATKSIGRILAEADAGPHQLKRTLGAAQLVALGIGAIIGAGLLIDTFVVRTITVPALAALIGRANWWPTKSRKAAPGRKAVDADAR